MTSRGKGGGGGDWWEEKSHRAILLNLIVRDLGSAGLFLNVSEPGDRLALFTSKSSVGGSMNGKHKNFVAVLSVSDFTPEFNISISIE